MTSSAAKRLTLHHLLAGGAVLAVLVGFGQPWSTITLQTGQTVSLTGNQQAPLALSLLLVTAAAHALKLLLYGRAHRITSGIQAGAAGGALWAGVAALGAAVDRARQDITVVTGLSGQDTVDQLVAEVQTALFPAGVSVLGCGLFLASALIGVSVNRVRKMETSRFDRPAAQTEQHPWDQLSNGVDPTDR